ncbi:MAG: DUF2062 domain-containing protein [Mariprofundaceae bacterium]|nr:DUF2062 domain-containing protein [Mariprofundaceae bacterium]
MPKKIFQRYMPDHRKIRDQKCLQCFGKLLHNPALWHLNRHSLARAFFIGLICAFIPVPFQMILAAAGAILINANLPISVALVWLTNPVTMPPVYYACYKTGAWVMNLPEQNFHFELSMDWLIHGMLAFWQPFLLGCAVLGVISGVLGYITVKISWRWLVVQRWRHRHQRHIV